MSPVNTDELEVALMEARQRVLKIQTKLHRWAVDDPHRRFDDLFNLVADPAFLLVACADPPRPPRRPSPPGRASRSSSTNYGRN